MIWRKMHKIPTIRDRIPTQIVGVQRRSFQTGIRYYSQCQKVNLRNPPPPAFLRIFKALVDSTRSFRRSSCPRRKVFMGILPNRSVRIRDEIVAPELKTSAAYDATRTKFLPPELAPLKPSSDLITPRS
jgi:hypothetical protein